MSTAHTNTPPAWVDRFLSALRAGDGVRASARAAGIDHSAPYKLRKSDRAFREAWEAIRPVGTQEGRAGNRRLPPCEDTRERFLTKLAETSNVTLAAGSAGLAVSTIYALRRDDPQFAGRWYAALAEGYDNLEMELLGRLRGGQDAAKDKFDTATALRCLAAHRESVAREKGRRTLAEEVITIASINAKIDALRLRGVEGRKAITTARRSKPVASRKASRALPPPTAKEGSSDGA